MSPFIEYVPTRFHRNTMRMIDAANEIIGEYMAQGYTLTLRQLFYQFVSRDLFANTQKNYKRLGDTISKARLAGLVDWEAIEDRTRGLKALAHWRDEPQIMGAIANQFRVDRWEFQPYRVEVWIEKEALAGVFERVCNQWDVPFFCCRGYNSQSEAWAAAQRLMAYEQDGQEVLILHFGDHDPSGIDMTRDIKDRMAVFGCEARIERLALNMDQVREWGPPPNPMKFNDPRSGEYRAKYGNQSWELDALDPRTLSALVEEQIQAVIEDDTWEADQNRIDNGRTLLSKAAKNWTKVVNFLETV